MTGHETPKPRPWLRLPAVVALASTAVLAVAWGLPEVQRATRVIATMTVATLAAVVLLAWFLGFSGLSRAARLAGLAGLLLAAGAFRLLFRIEGMTGDLVPIVRSRLASARPAPAVGVPPPASIPVAVPSAAAQPAPSASAPAPAPSDGVPSAAPSETPVRATDGDDFPRFQGPTADGILPPVRLATDWTAQPPRRLWRQPVGTAWSGFAVAGGLAVTLEQHGDDEQVVAYDVRSGRPRWSRGHRTRFTGGVMAGDGPRATPTIDGGRVYAMGGTGRLSALDLHTGRVLWTRDVPADHDARPPGFGHAGSPLLVDGRVVVSAGGPGRTLVAYDATTGEKAWAAGDDRAAYSSPVLRTLAGRPQIVLLSKTGVAGYDTSNGTRLWWYPWETGAEHVATPVVVGPDRLLVSIGYGQGSTLLDVTRKDGSFAATELWRSPRLKSKFANVIVHGGFVYGLDDGVFVCLDPSTGERRWKAERYGHGQLLLVGEHLLVQTEEGEVALVRPSPDGHQELARFAALEGKTWNPPALAGRLLVVRNDREAAAYELP